MVYCKNAWIRFAVLLLTATATPPVTGEFLAHGLVLAQSFGESPDSFPIPSSLPDESLLKVDGSTSMRLVNQQLESRFETQYPNIDVELDASRTDEAIAALINGDIQLVATGRPLTSEERAQGLVEVPIEREKLAFIVGPDNEFDQNLTFEQFAAIFRGEITNWSELGGPDRTIRLIDRPDHSDTRRALSTYEVFQGQPFATGDTAASVAIDETEVVIEALGNDGIGYAVYSQVEGLETVQILSMHQTLPDDPRYPYSQYRAFVYNEAAAPPAALAFLGFVTSPPGQEVITDAEVTAAGTDPTANSESDGPAATNADVTGDASDTTGDDAADTTDGDAADTAEVPVAPGEAPATGEEETTGLVPAEEAANETGGGFPWWLLGIPIVGGLLWWLLKGLGGGSTPASTAASDTTPGTTPATPIGAATAPPATVPTNAATAVPPTTTPVGGTAGIAAAGMAAAGVTAAGIAAAQSAPRLVLTPRNSRDAYAYWDIPSDRLATAQCQGGEKMTLRLYDITGRGKGAALPTHIAEFDCVGAEPDMHLPIEVADHDYLAEVGYVTSDNRWLPLVTSEPVRVPALFGGIPNNLGGVTGAALGGAAALAGATGLAAVASKSTDSSRIILTPRTSQDAYAYWEVPTSRLNDLQSQDGDLMVRLYDVTGCANEATLPAHIAQFECDGSASDRHLPIETADRDYCVDLGYLTRDGRWLSVTQSDPVHIPASLQPAVNVERPEQEGSPADARFPGVAIAGAAAVGAAAVGAAKSLGDTSSSMQQSSRIVLTPRNEKKAYAYWEVSDQAKAVVKAEGGYQLRIYDVTDIDMDKQPPHSVLTYAVNEADCDRAVPLPAADRDYIAEIGYRADDGTWFDLARSLHVRGNSVLDQSNVNPAALGVAGGVAAAAGTALGMATSPANSTPQTGPCTIQTVSVHSRHNAVLLDAGQMHELQQSVSANQSLDTGLYILKLREGVFNYDGDGCHPGEPFVLLWIYGGKVVNQKTGVSVNATWSTLNGYADTLTLDVHEPAQICAFFIDTYPDDNIGEVTLSVIKL